MANDRRRLPPSRRSRPLPGPRPPALPPPIAPPPPEAAPPAPPDLTDLARLTEQVLQLLSSSDKRAVAVRAEVGRVLLVIRAQLAPGRWRAWLRGEVPLTPSTADRAIRLYRLSQTDRPLFERIAPAGLAKVYVLVTLPPATVELLLAGTHRIPSSGAHKTLVAMTFSDLMEVLASLTDTANDDPSAILLVRYRRQIRALVRTLDALIEAQPALAADDDELADLLDDLLHASARFAEAFALEQD